MGGKGSGAKPKHGMRGASFYNVWRNIKARCKRPTGKNSAYSDVSYPKEWERFESFVSDMIKGYSEGKQIDRIDPYANYSKENCRWVDANVNACNKRKKENTSSKYYGVSFHKKTGKYQAEIRFNHKRYYGGIFKREEHAARMVNIMIEENNLPNRKNDV